ncbi:MAG: hypothetical protein IV097_02005 [Burkholderiaceae bacterium]|nr:hypothetical protein [Burkholderiaceae bacterium]
MKASKTVTTIFAAATLVGAISLAYAQASADMQPAEPTQTEQLQPSTDISPAPVSQVQDASGTPAGTQAVPAETTGNVPDNSAPLITERSPRADRN